jgi:multidrug transporter EmrE-like cation transporter
VGSLALVLILASAVLHAGWNLLGKGSGVDIARFLIATVAGSILLSPALLLFPDRVAAIPANVWTSLELTAIWQVVYFAALSGAYRSGQFSIAYPIARALPLVLVMVWTCATAAVLPQTPFLAFALVIAGCLMLPLRSLRGGFAATGVAGSTGVNGRSLAYVCLAGLATSGYSIVDDYCIRQLTSSAGGGYADAIVYGALETWAVALNLAVIVLGTRSGRARLAEAWPQRRIAIAVGCGVSLSTLLVLLAMPLTPHIGWTLAFRQASIPLGAIAGIIWFQESASAPKMLGLMLIVVGLGWAAW